MAAASDGKHKKLRSAIVSSDETEVAGRWLLERQEYKTWVDTPQSLLWLYGECMEQYPETELHTLTE